MASKQEKMLRLLLNMLTYQYNHTNFDAARSAAQHFTKMDRFLEYKHSHLALGQVLEIR